MSFQAMAWAVKQKVGNATGKAILLMLANYADERGECFPSQETLARECECSKRSVLDWLQKFEAMGLLTRKRRHTSGGYRRADLLRLSLSAGNSRENVSGENPSEPKCSTFTAEPITEPIRSSSLRSDEVALAVQAYSEMADRAGLPKPRIVNDARRRKIAATLKAYSLDLWREAVAAIEASDFCRGQNDRGWVADLDFLLQRKSFDGLIEGKYENRQPRGSPSRRPPSLADAMLALSEGLTNGQDGNRTGNESDWGDAAGFPRLIEHQR